MTTSACEDPTLCEEAAKYEASVELGVGARVFRPIEDGFRLETDFGPQGGQHAWLAFRTRGFEPGRKRRFGDDPPGPTIKVTYYTADETELVASLTTMAVPEGTAELAELVGQPLVLHGGWDDPEGGYDGGLDESGDEGDGEEMEYDVQDGILKLVAEDHCGTSFEKQWTLHMEID